MYPLYLTYSPLQISTLVGAAWTDLRPDRLTPTSKLLVANGLAREPV